MYQNPYAPCNSTEVIIGLWVNTKPEVCTVGVQCSMTQAQFSTQDVAVQCSLMVPVRPPACTVRVKKSSYFILLHGWQIVWTSVPFPLYGSFSIACALSHVCWRVLFCLHSFWDESQCLQFLIQLRQLRSSPQAVSFAPQDSEVA